MPSIETIQSAWQLSSLSANLAATSAVTDRPAQAGTRSAGPTAAATGVMVRVSDNNLKLIPLVETSGYAVDTRVVGWRFCESAGIWIPELLGQFTTTAHTVGLPVTINTKTFYPAISATVNQGSANIRVVNGTGYGAPMSILVDHQGCEWIELLPTTAVAKAVNYFHSFN